MPKIIDYDARKHEIAVKAAGILARDGILEANLGKVADFCGLGRTTLYQYFRNIDELVEFTLAETFGRLDEEAETLQADSDMDAVARLLAFLGFLEKEAIEDKERMVLALDFLLHPSRKLQGMSFDVQERVRVLRRQLEAILAAAVSSGELRPMDTTSMAFTLFAFIEAATVHSVLYNNISLQDTMRDIRMLVDGLRTEH